MKVKKTWRQLLFTVLAGTLVFWLAGCGGGQQPNSSTSSNTSTKTGGKVVFGICSEPDHFDPYLARAADTRSILINIFEGLVKITPEGKIEPALAQSYNLSSDYMAYTFTLRKGIKFHNGNAVTVEDVKYSIETAAGLTPGKTMVSGLENIKSVDVVDSSTIRINLKVPNAQFLPYLTVAIVPKGYTQQDTHPIGAGPFEFASFTPQVSLILKKNPNYWQPGVPYLDEVNIKIESNMDEAIMDLQGGSIDVLPSITMEKLPQIQSNPNLQLVFGNNSSVQQMGMNNAVKPFTDVRVRQAMCYAINPDEIIKTLGFGHGTRVGTPIVAGLKDYNDSKLATAYMYDPAKARELLSEAGYPNGFNLTITVSSNYQTDVNTAQIIVSELKAVGVNASIQEVDWATWLSKVFYGRQYQATVIDVDFPFLSPAGYLQRYQSNEKLNYNNYKNPEYDTLYKQALAAVDPNKQSELYTQLQEMLSKTAPSVFIQDRAIITATKKGVTGYVFYPFHIQDLSTIHYTK